MSIVCNERETLQVYVNPWNYKTVLKPSLICNFYLTIAQNTRRLE